MSESHSRVNVPTHCTPFHHTTSINDQVLVLDQTRSETPTATGGELLLIVIVGHELEELICVLCGIIKKPQQGVLFCFFLAEQFRAAPDAQIHFRNRINPPHSKHPRI